MGRRFWAMLHMASMALVVVAVIALWLSDVWAWEGELVVRGNRIVGKQELLAKLNLPPRRPLYLVNPIVVAEGLHQLPAVREVAVRRWLFPARLEINVLEREALVPVATPAGGIPRWLDQDGVVFEAPRRLVKPTFTIVLHTGLQPGDRLPPKAVSGLFEALNAWPEEGGVLDLRRLDDVGARLGGWNVRLGELGDTAVKLALFQHLKPLAAKYKPRLDYINLRFAKSPSFVLRNGDEVKGEPGASWPDASATGTPSPLPSPEGAASTAP